MEKTAKNWLSDLFDDSVWELMGAPGDVGKQFSVHFSGNLEAAKKRANRAFASLKLGKVFVEPDKNQQQKITQMFTRKLCRLIAEKMGAEYLYSKDSATISPKGSWQSVAKVKVEGPKEPPMVYWALEKGAQAGISDEVREELKVKLKQTSTKRDEILWSL
eukprot:9888656-Karenia_brevis.AAC.2